MFACAQHDGSSFSIRLWEVSYLGMDQQVKMIKKKNTVSTLK